MKTRGDVSSQGIAMSSKMMRRDIKACEPTFSGLIAVPSFAVLCEPLAVDGHAHDGMAQLLAEGTEALVVLVAGSAAT
jgi:hypothetical protein